MRSSVLAVLVAGIAIAPGMLAATAPPPPDGLAAKRLADDGVTLTWLRETGDGDLFRVFASGNLLGHTKGTNWTHADAGEGMHVYAVRAAYRGVDLWSDPSTVAVPTVGCEVVSTSTSWNPPFLHATVHEECLGVAAWHEFTWSLDA